MSQPVYNKATDTWEYDSAEKEAEDKLAQTRAELRAMLSGNQPFYADPRAARALPEHAAPYGKKARVLNSLGSAMQAAYENIGGCSCHLGGAPCMSCMAPGHPITLEETPEVWENEDGWTAFPHALSHTERVEFSARLATYMPKDQRYEIWFGGVAGVPPWSVPIETHMGFMLYNLGGDSPVSHWRAV